MNFEIHNLSGYNTESFMRKLGYKLIAKEGNGQLNFVREIGIGGYPRFHIYLREGNGGVLYISMHFDQSRPVYKGATAHGGDYSGEILDEEKKRIDAVNQSLL